MINKKLMETEINKVRNTMELTEENNLSKLSKSLLLQKCNELGFVKCKSKNKKELINKINSFRYVFVK